MVNRGEEKVRVHMNVVPRSSGLFMGLSSTIIYTSELILCSTICVPSAIRGTTFICTLTFSSPRFTI